MGHQYLGLAAGGLAALLVLAAPAAAQPDIAAYFGGEAEKAEKVRDYERAAQFYTRILAIKDLAAVRRRDILRKRALAFEWTKKFPAADADWAEALKVEPVDPLLYSARGFYFLRRQRFADALSDFVAGERRDPRNGVFPYGQGRVLAAQGDLNAAIERFGAAIRLEPEVSARYLSRAEAYARLTLHREARADFDRAVTLALPESNDALIARLGRGNVLFVTGDYEAAIRDFDKVLVRYPEDVTALKWRGFAYEKLGQATPALADYERAFQIRPNDAWIRDSLRRVRSR